MGLKENQNFVNENQIESRNPSQYLCLKINRWFWIELHWSSIPYDLGAFRTPCTRSTWAAQAGSHLPGRQTQWRAPGAAGRASSHGACLPGAHAGAWPAFGWSGWAGNTRHTGAWHTPCSTWKQCESHPHHSGLHTNRDMAEKKPKFMIKSLLLFIVNINTHFNT